ncbi:hypothetical protein FBBAL38_11769 [Flavobacteria bacterium BAL38]|nr:hypothetical protein FBBAL38_11769 [Flavobacteria bacterium BAL38]
MKKLITICLIMATLFTVNAQDGKPTKEQTVEFIKAYFKDKAFNLNKREGDSFQTWKYRNTIVEFDFNSSVMTIQYEMEYNYNNYKLQLKDNQIFNTKYVFNLVDIEKINYTYSGRGTDYNIVFEFIGVPNKILKEHDYTGEKDVKKITLPVDKTYSLEPTAEATKLLKAFNHLRKLCGAPDPISFD